ncbi:hypothetical protein EDD36DRAFT_299041 [Exophiala viscosa]|uniref:Uncharacterized protein n=1 Tax=Exophiala viscosa TaxID=2486360 RepID=A0AAN6IBW4_9EURO|nr:hypothetical protein EDD36DRAFT_299041 [Exophiala viscosa]
MAPSPPTEAEILQSYLLHPSPLSTILPYSAFQALIPASSRQNLSLKRLYRDLQFQRNITIDDIRRRIEDECRRSTTLTARLARQIRREEDERERLRSSRAQQRNTNTLKGKRTATATGSTTDIHTNEGIPSGVSTRNAYHDDNQNANNDDSHDNDHHDHDDDSGPDAYEHNDGSSFTDAGIDIHIDRTLHGPLGSALPNKSQNSHTTESLLKGMKTAKGDLQSEIEALEAQIASVYKDCEERVGGLSDLRYGRFAQNRTSTESANGETSIEDEVVGALEELRARLQPANS